MTPTTSLPPRGRPRAAAILAISLPAAALAGDVAAAPGVSWGAMLQSFAGLLLLLALFVGAAWLARRFGAGKGAFGNRGPLKVVSGVAISPRERILLIEIEDTWLVVGIAPGQMRTLHALPKGHLPEGDTEDAKFADWLRKFRNGKADDAR